MTAYFPAADNWQSLDPATAGFDPAQLAAAFSYAATQEITASRDLRDMVPKGERHPYDRQLGPLQDRSPAAGLVVKNGYLVGSFGPIDSVEVTFSCSKSYISAVAGLACNDGLFNDLDAPVGHSSAASYSSQRELRRDRRRWGCQQRPQLRPLTAPP